MTDEQQKPVPEVKEQPQEAKGLVDKAYEVAAQLEAANKQALEIIQRQESILAKQMLAGRADAGAVIKQPTTEELAQAEADKMLSLYRRR
jgi:hypothetical protein